MNTLSQIFRAALYPFRVVLDWARSFLVSTWGFILAAVSLIVAPLGWLADFVIWIQGLMLSRLVAAQELVSGFWADIGAAFLVLAGPLAFINSFIPLGQLLVAFSLLLALWVIALLYRFVKSLIPTLT
jgi:hypothetical protein